MSMLALRRGTMASRAAGFTPTSIAGLRLWLDATAITPQADNTAIASWADGSGNGHNGTRAGTDAGPFYRTGANGINGLAAVRSAGGDNGAYLTFANVFSGLTAATVFIVAKTAADPQVEADSGLWWFSTAGTNGHYNFSDGNIYESFGTNTRKTVGNPVPALTAQHVYGIVTAASDYRVYLDGVPLFSTTSNTVGFGTAPRLLASPADTFGGTVGEVILYNTALSLANRVTVEAYLRAKWGITAITDSFDRANSTTTLGNTDTGQAWSAVSGTWGVISNWAYAPSAGIAAVEFGATNMAVQARIATSDAGTGVLARVQDASNFYMALCNVSGNQTVLYKCVAGSFTVIAGPVNGLASNDLVRITANGTTISVHKNGTQIMSVTDSALTTGTKGGLRADSSSARWDDFSVVAP